MLTTKGNFRVDVNFNPSQDKGIAHLKNLAAQLIDEVECLDQDDSNIPEDVRKEVQRLKALAQTNIEQAAMWAVKARAKFIAKWANSGSSNEDNEKNN